MDACELSLAQSEINLPEQEMVSKSVLDRIH